jgi:hypothetical protein
MILVWLVMGRVPLSRARPQAEAAIPDRPTKGDAERFLGRLSHLMWSFPFVGDVDRAIASPRRSRPDVHARSSRPGGPKRETEKCLGALLFAGVSIVSLDNVSADLGGELL